MILKGSSSSGIARFSLTGVVVEVHAQIVRSCVDGNDVLYTALFDAYVKRERIYYARRVCDSMLERNVICSTSMITGYMNRGR